MTGGSGSASTRGCGPALLVAFRLGSYTAAAWQTLVQAGEPPASGSATPFQEFCVAVKLLVRHKVLRGVKVLPLPPLHRSCQ